MKAIFISYNQAFGDEVTDMQQFARERWQRREQDKILNLIVF